MGDDRAVPLRHLKPQDARRVPWKNGRGVTEELALWPPGASFERGDFDWRIARAGVAEDGSFSEFPGFERVLVVCSGEGLLLRHGLAAPVRVPRLQSHRFSGDDATTAELLAGAAIDVNVLARRGRVAAEVSVLRAGRLSLPASDAEHSFVHVIEGDVAARVAGGSEPVTLSPRESLWILGEAPPIELQPAGSEHVLLLVRLRTPN